MRHLSYAVMLAFCLAATLTLHRVFHLDVLRQPRRLALSILPAAVVFVIWDLAATRAGHWAFDPAQTLPFRLAGLPLEEIAFFLVIPLAGLLTFEAVGVVLRRTLARDGGDDR
ncbi:MAG: lycopene cyclase domain-containing protein [Actinomycetota bacterium]|nr:lycopene cyclase domain-containing protein [Actinomycetota bacterium]